MKKLLSLLSLSFLLLAGSLTSQAMDSDTLLQSPDRYRVVSAQNDSVVYVDINTIQAIQTMDYPNSLENLSCTLYVETYAHPLDAEAYQSGRLIRQINEYKAGLLYDFIDNSSFYTNNVVKKYRSIMNVPFVTPNAELDAKFVKEAGANGLVSLKGHRLVGGMRASIYNAMPVEGVKALIEFMKKFEKENA